MNTAETLAALRQEVLDFKRETLNKLTSIETQTKKTNGRVNGHDTKLQIIEKNQKECPARVYHLSTTRYSRYTTFTGITIAIVALIQLFVAIKQFR